MRSTRHVTGQRSRRGATLVELLVALLLFDLALLSLVAVSAVAVRRLGEGGRRNRAAIAATSRVERLTALACASPTFGSALLERGITEHWTSQSIAGGRDVMDSVRIEARPPEVLVMRTRRLC